MKKSSSKPRFGSSSCANPVSNPAHSKNRTASSVVHTQVEQIRTTKKNSIGKKSSCSRVQSLVNLKQQTKNNFIKIQNKSSRVQSRVAGAQEGVLIKNQKLLNQNNALRQEYCQLQEAHIKDKAKIHTLLSKLSEFRKEPDYNLRKKHSDNGCENSKCLERRKYLQLELHQERMKVCDLEEQKKVWESSKEQLKGQYKSLLDEIHLLRQAN